MALLSVRNLAVEFDNGLELVHAVRDVSLELHKGEALGLVGESGCGKTVTAYSILKLVKSPGRIVRGEVHYAGRDLLQIPDAELRRVRGGKIAMIFQEPMTSLNPVFKIGSQISETVRLHRNCGRDDAKKRSLELLDMVGIPDPARRFNSYPHELSGGMRQRVMIAIALAGDPDILVADEPTTALDVTIQAQILDLLQQLRRERTMSLILISHDLGIVSSVVDRVAIMYAGEIIEQGAVAEVFDNPLHPYTRGLLRAVPRLGARQEKLYTIPGSVPRLSEIPAGCVFYPRCEEAAGECVQSAVALGQAGSRLVRCVRRMEPQAVQS